MLRVIWHSNKNYLWSLTIVHVSHLPRTSLSFLCINISVDILGHESNNILPLSQGAQSRPSPGQTIHLWNPLGADTIHLHLFLLLLLTIFIIGIIYVPSLSFPRFLVLLGVISSDDQRRPKPFLCPSVHSLVHSLSQMTTSSQTLLIDFKSQGEFHFLLCKGPPVHVPPSSSCEGSCRKFLPDSRIHIYLLRTALGMTILRIMGVFREL